MTKKHFLLTLFTVISYAVFAQHILESPDKKIKVSINIGNTLSFSLNYRGDQVIKNANLNLVFNDQELYKSENPELITKQVSDLVNPLIPYKHSEIKNQYNELKFVFSNGFSVEFRAFNEGVVYRYVTTIDEEVEVNEKAELSFAGDLTTWLSQRKNFSGNYESTFDKGSLYHFPDTMQSYLPILMKDKHDNKILLLESDVVDYPHMYFKGSGSEEISALFPPYPLEVELKGDRASKVVKTADYIAKTNGNRTFPWRVFMITNNEKQLVESELVYLLARKMDHGNTDWIKPGRVSWDWWNALNLYGVDFKTGLNTETYKYYIDFASKNGLEYVILDEGWSFSTMDLTKPNPDIDLQYLIKYGKEKNVGIILWSTWRALNEQWSVLDNFKKWGVAGIKVDFMDRDDQWMVNFYEKAAKETFKRKLLIDFHGSFKPTGLRRSYPNIVSYEGVMGLEYCKWSKAITPEHNLMLPFTRMVCGPMDYTPGAMRNHHRPDNHPVMKRPVSHGTRCHQVALFVLYESGIQMLADSPTNYEREQETTDFIARIPVTWDDIKVLEAKVGEYLILARRKGDTWYIGGITNEEPREFTIGLSFLDSGEHTATIMQDGINADRFAEDYKKLTKQVGNKSELVIKMVKGGGFAAIIEQ